MVDPLESPGLRRPEGEGEEHKSSSLTSKVSEEETLRGVETDRSGRVHVVKTETRKGPG